MKTKTKHSQSVLPNGYSQLLNGLKKTIKEAQLKAAISVNQELIILYWNIGREILKKQKSKGWGAKVIDRLAKDLLREFPEMSGFSPRNLMFMRSLAEAYTEATFVKQAVSQIPWGHNIRILQLIKDDKKRKWYIYKTIEHGWSRNIMIHQIESELYERQGKAITNFESTLPAQQSDLARQIIKDPYNFDFLTLSDKANERDLEKELLLNIRNFLLELGVGFSFVGNQVRLEVGNEDFYIDLLFYHLQLRSYVVIELKHGKFQPEFTGKMNFYLSAVDDLLRHPSDNPTIGLILCKDKNKIVAEYALRDINKPIGVSAYKLTKMLPKKLKGSLPTIKELEDEIRK